MERFTDMVIRHKKMVIALFVAAAAVSALLFFTVNINYNMADYLPPDAQSTRAIQLLAEEFPQKLPNANVTLKEVSLQEALRFKGQLMALEHIEDVLWLDDVADLTRPIEMGDPETIGVFYQDGDALFSVVVEGSFEKEGVQEIRALLGGRGTVTGDAAEIEYVQTATGTEVLNALIILLPLILLILILSTTSWIEPLLFLAAVGMSVVINMGTNAFSDNVSFLTNSVTPILQLAVSLDYAIFLLHSFGDHRKEGFGVDEAMRMAVKESFSTVAASASTTLFGFLALLFMQFQIGGDLGLSLAKGILFSFISVMVFLPALTLCVYKRIDKTRHRVLLPAFSNIHRGVRVLAIPAVLIVLIVLVPSFLGQSNTSFVYGYQAAFDQMQGQNMEDGENATVMVLLVPKGDVVKEGRLCDDLLTLTHVTSVQSYASTVGTGIPAEFLDASMTEQFYSEHYARLVVTTDTPAEGDVAFGLVEDIQDMAGAYYPEGVYSLGQSANLYDIKTVVQKDNMLTNIIAILSIFLVLLITFRSVLLPFLLLLTIEAAIWINLSIPYFTGVSINYVGYLILNTVQLGATVDYAILLTVTYRRNRLTMPQGQAIHSALGSSFRSILVSATTLAVAGFTLAGTSSNPLIGDIGMLLGRGTLLSMVMVVVFLPAMLTLFDKAIEKTTWKPGNKRSGRMK